MKMGNLSRFWLYVIFEQVKSDIKQVACSCDVIAWHVKYTCATATAAAKSFLMNKNSNDK